MSIRRGNNILASSGTNGLALFDFKWSDHTIVDPNWILSSPNSWHSGNTYKKMYNHLQTDYTNGESQSETIATYTITYMLAPDGHKIILPEHETIAQSIYTATGVAWYYVLDTTNKQFKLPRTKYAFNSGAPETVGNYIEPGLPNITGKLLMANHYNYDNTSINNAITGAFATTVPTSAGVKLTQAEPPSSSSADGVWSVTMDASRCSSIYGNSDTVQPPAVSMLLYFFTDQFENGQQEAQETYALDSTVVHLTGNETINGTKTFVQPLKIQNGNSTSSLIVDDNNITIKNTAFDSSTTTAPGSWTDLGIFRMFDENDNYTGYVENAFTTGNYVQTSLGARRIVDGANKTASIKAMVDSSGNGRVEMSEAHVAANVKVINNGVTMGTNPSGIAYTALEFKDKTDGATWNQTRLGIIESKVNTDGSTEMNMSTKKFVSGDSAQATIWVKETAAGVSSCGFPNTTCCDGPIVAKNVTICDGVSINGSTVATYTLTDLPNDGKSYMALIRAQISTGATSGNAAYGNIHTDLITATISLCRIKATSASARFAAGTCWVPVSSSRKIYLHRDTGWNGTCTLALIGYRRIGTNG